MELKRVKRVQNAQTMTGIMGSFRTGGHAQARGGSEVCKTGSSRIAEFMNADASFPAISFKNSTAAHQLHCNASRISANSCASRPREHAPADQSSLRSSANR